MHIGGVEKFRDPIIDHLVLQTNDLMKSISDEEDKLQGYVEVPVISRNGLSTPLSVEDAIRELMSLKKDIK